MNRSDRESGSDSHAALAHSLSGAGLVKHEHVLLNPDPSRTVIRPFSPDYPDAFRRADRPRSLEIIERVMSLEPDALTAELRAVQVSLDERHRDVDALLLRRSDEIVAGLNLSRPLSEDERRLVGAYFSEEYAFEAAALFNPSVVIAPDQTISAGSTIRFIMSLRGIGEGHVSSVTFRTGMWTPGDEVQVDAPSRTAIPPIIERSSNDDGTVQLLCDNSREVSETVLFPILPRQRQGIEDLRLVRFVDDDGTAIYYGTYTAFSGVEARPELLSTSDFHRFEMRPLAGDAAQSKGMALFPRRVDGRYTMLGRQDNESIWLHQSDQLLTWNGGGKLVSPHFPWEFVQLGNCGSPMEIEEGWLVLTHGVGAVRNYCIGACLLDRDDPSRLLARSSRPILEPSPAERDGYVPNVVYSCGGIVRDRMLMLPFGVADTFATIATMPVDSLLADLS